jgi:hypothetical protein
MGTFFDLAGEIYRLLNFFIRQASLLGLSKKVFKTGNAIGCCGGSNTDENLRLLFHGFSSFI